MKINYQSEDGLLFGDAEDCARYELKKFPEMLANLKETLKDVPDSFQQNWCSNGVCGCIGCVNHYIAQAGLTHSHWKVYMSDYYIPSLSDDNKYCGVIITHGEKADDLDELKQILRIDCQLSPINVITAIRSENAIIAKNLNFTKAEDLKNKLEATGVKVSIYNYKTDNIIE